MEDTYLAAKEETEWRKLHGNRPTDIIGDDLSRLSTAKWLEESFDKAFLEKLLQYKGLAAGIK